VLSTPPSSPDAADSGGKIETTQEELDAYATAGRLLGPEREVGYEDSVAYFKIHLAARRTWVFCRLQMNRKNPLVWVPLPPDQVASLAPGRPQHANGAWTAVSLDSAAQVGELGPLLIAAFASVKQSKVGAEAEG
jgi:hypothetical protein